MRLFVHTRIHPDFSVTKKYYELWVLACDFKIIIIDPRNNVVWVCVLRWRIWAEIDLDTWLGNDH